jgi:hypothetical protein
VHRSLAAALLAALAVTGCAAEPTRVSAPAPRPAATPVVAPALPSPGHLSARARLLRGPREMSAEHTHGRTLTMRGNHRATRRLLIAGCIDGTTCAGTDVVYAAMIGCPPPDAEMWFFPTLDPGGTDLAAHPEHPGAQAFRQAAVDLRPKIAIVFRNAAQPRVRGRDAARRFARTAALPYTREAPRGLTALPESEQVIVELPPGRPSKRTAARLAHAIDRLAGTRFAQGADEDRRRMIATGQDPRAQN